jgi:hypothetical protein
MAVCLTHCRSAERRQQKITFAEIRAEGIRGLDNLLGEPK